MPSKLTRVTQQVFGLNGNPANFGQFGSKIANPSSPVLTLDPASIQALSAFTTDGWIDAVYGANSQPFIQDMNGLFRVAFYQIAQIFQDGIPVWDPGTNYFTGSIARQDGTSNLFASLTNNNLGNALPVAPASNGFWAYLNPSTIPAGSGMEYYGLVLPPGFLWQDGASYPTASYPNLFAAIGYQFGGSGANFNVPNAAGRTAVGIGGTIGLTLGQLYGEATHTLAVGEIPANLTVNDPEHFHSLQVSGSTGVVAVISSGPNQNISGGGSPGGSFAADATVAAPTGISVGGGGGAHNNVQPSIGVNKIIKF